MRRGKNILFGFSTADDSRLVSTSLRSTVSTLGGVLDGRNRKRFLPLYGDLRPCAAAASVVDGEGLGVVVVVVVVVGALCVVVTMVV